MTVDTQSSEFESAMKAGRAALQAPGYKLAAARFDVAATSAPTDEDFGKAMQMKGVSLRMLADYDEALLALNIAQGVAHRLGNARLEGAVYRDLGQTVHAQAMSMYDAVERHILMESAALYYKRSMNLLVTVDFIEYNASKGFYALLEHDRGNHKTGLRLLRDANLSLRQGNHRVYEFNNLIRLMRISIVDRVLYLPRAIWLTRQLDTEGNKAGQLQRVLATLPGDKAYVLLKRLKQQSK